MSTPLGGEPAFPLPAIQAQNGEWQNATYFGMSTRTWLAGTIAAGMIANEWFMPEDKERTAMREHGPQLVRMWTENAVTMADALLSALQRSTSPTHTEATPEPQKGS